jgi:ACS family tartrate transporter-like MFS transporter
MSIERAAMHKAQWRIVPLIALAYLCAYTDRVNVSFAAASMNADLGFSATIYGLGAGLFFLGYALFEVPSNLMCVRFGPRKWLARIMITWGLLSAGTMFVTTPSQFYALRFLLGIAEAGFYPGVIYYLSHWFVLNYRGTVVSRFFIAGPLTSVVLGAISGWLLDLDGLSGMQGWQWLFLAQGLPSVLAGLLVLAFLPERPAAVGWLSDEEKTWLTGELAHEQASHGQADGHSVLAALRNPRVLSLGIFGMLLMGAVTTLVLSAPLVLMAATGQSIHGAGWIVSIGGMLGVAVMLWAGPFADRRSSRFGDALIYSLILTGSLLALALAPSAELAIAAYLLFAAICFAIPMLTSAGWIEVLSARELAVGAAAINTLSQIGAFVTPFAWGALKDATGTFQAGLLMLAGLGAMLSLWLYGFIRGYARASGRLTV